MLDLLHWNTTLRMDVTTAARRTEETDRVHSQGLVALSVNGNHITEEGIGILRRAIKSNFWVLGLNIANNRIEKAGIDVLINSLRDNNALHAVLIGGNPGTPLYQSPSLLSYVYVVKYKCYTSFLMYMSNMRFLLEDRIDGYK